MASYLVHEGFKHHPFSGIRSPIRLHEGCQSGTHPHSALDKWAGGTHVGREARGSAARLAPYPQALRCRSTRGRYCRAARRWTKAWQKNSGSDKIPYFLSLRRRRTDSINLFLSETLFVFLWVIKCDMYSFKAFSNGDKRWKNSRPVDWFETKHGAELAGEKPTSRPINPASPGPQPITGLYLGLGGDNVPTRRSRTSSANKRGKRENRGRGEEEKYET